MFFYERAIIMGKATTDATIDKEKLIIRNQNAEAFSVLLNATYTLTSEGELNFKMLSTSNLITLSYQLVISLRHCS